MAEAAIYPHLARFPSSPPDRSYGATQGTAAQRTFERFGTGSWAGVDSGIQRDHPHFLGYQTVNHHRERSASRLKGRAKPPLRRETGTHACRGISPGGMEKWKSSNRQGDCDREKTFNALAGRGFPYRASRGYRNLTAWRDGPAREAGRMKVSAGGGRPQTPGEQGAACPGIVREKNAARHGHEHTRRQPEPGL